MRRILAGFFLILVLLTNIASATDWYVRPAGGNYGNEDGMNYTNAWDGLGNVVWGTGGVDAGDTLYVCGLHLRNHTGGSKGEKIIVNVSGTENNRVTIRGDCPSDPGIIWGAGIISYDTWTDEGGGVYSITIGGNYDGSSFFFEDITANNWTVL